MKRFMKKAIFLITIPCLYIVAHPHIPGTLAEKVEEGRFSKDNAMEIARLLFNENAKRWYGLEG